MQKILIGVAAVVIVGGGIWYITSQSSNDQMTSETGGSALSESEQLDNKLVENTKITGSDSLANLFGFGENVRCEFSSVNVAEGDRSSGTFYTDGERFRVEAMYTTSEGVVTTNMINDGEYAYTWGKTPQGEMAIKAPNMEVEGEADPSSLDFGPDDEESYVDINERVEYDCDRWNVDSKVFIPPSDIEFMDMEAMMREAMEGMPEGFELPEGVELPEGFEMP